jgi:WD40 repeat protein
MLAVVEESHVRVWQVESAKEVRVFDGGGVADVEFSPDGKRLAAAGVHGLVVWDLADGSEKARNEAAKPEFLKGRLSFSRDGAGLLLQGQDSVDVWGAVDGQKSKTIASGCSMVAEGAWAVWCSPNPPRLMDVAGDKEIPVRIAPACKWGNRRAVSRSGRWIACAHQTEPIIELDDTSGRLPVRQLLGHHGAVELLQISSDERWMASYARDRTIRLWELAPEGDR